MKILKKDGTYQEFNREKIERSIENASTHMTMADIEMIAKEIERKLNLEGETISSYGITGHIIDSLVRNGFRNVAINYVKGFTIN